MRAYPRVYFAQAHHAAGIIEGIRYYNFLDTIQIPNDALRDPEKATAANKTSAREAPNGETTDPDA